MYITLRSEGVERTDFCGLIDSSKTFGFLGSGLLQWCTGILQNHDFVVSGAVSREPRLP